MNSTAQSITPPYDTTHADIETILQKRRVVSHYQPQVSIKRQSILGFEALSRGCDACQEAVLPPNILFSLPQTAQQRLELDRLCRSKALECFKPIHDAHKELLLSINIDIALLDTVAAGSKYLVKQARTIGINPNNIVIEIIESNVQNTDALLDFITRYREEGFLIALDDVGAGHSNMERIALIKPDVLKIDRSLVSSLHQQFYKMEVTKSLVGLGQRIGAMVVAEGVESAADAMKLLELGVDVFQGFHFSRPAPLRMEQHDTLQTIKDVAATFREHVLESFTVQKKLFAEYDALLQKLVGYLESVEESDFDCVLANFLSAHDDLECLYVLDEGGIQISETICNPLKIAEYKRFIYQPAQKGSDHSLKDYFLPLRAGMRKFTTESYISMASGNICTTLAASFSSTSGTNYIVCMDISRSASASQTVS